MNCLRCRLPVDEHEDICNFCSDLPPRVAAAIDACANLSTEALQDIVKDHNQVLFALVWADHVRATEPRKNEIINTIDSAEKLAEVLPTLFGLPKTNTKEN